MTWTAGIMLIGGFALTPGAWAHGSNKEANGVNWRNEYYLGAEPVGVDALTSQPASLFTMTRNRYLHLVRQFFRAAQHFSDFANDLHGTLYLAGRSGIYVIHAGDPDRAVCVPVHQFDDTFCRGAVHGRPWSCRPPSLRERLCRYACLGLGWSPRRWAGAVRQ